MSMVFNGMMAGLGQGIATMGAAWGKRETELEELKLKAELRRQEKLQELESRKELQALILATRGGGSGGGKGSGGDFDLSNADHRAFMGIEDPRNLKQSDFQKEVAPSTATDELGNAMPMIKQDDTEGFGKARQGIIDQNIRRFTMARNPDKFDDQQKGLAQEQVNEIGRMAMEEKDPKAKEALVRSANKMAIALGGKERFKISDGVVVDVAEGATETTEVGKAKIAEKEAQAGKHRADAGKASAQADEARADADRKRRDPEPREARGDGANNKRIEVLREDIARLEKVKAPTAEQSAELKRKKEQLEGIIDAGVPKKAADKPPAQKPSAADAGLPRPKTREEAMKLKPGTRFMDPNGNIRVR